MGDPILNDLLAGNAEHVTELPSDYFSEVLAGQHPDIVTICCSDSRVPQQGMWHVERPGAVFTPSNIGNQVWDDHNGERIVDGSLLYPVHNTGTKRIGVIGHTSCGAVTAAHAVATGTEPPETLGIRKWVEMLVPVIEEGLESDLVDAEAENVIDQLVEYNVDYQAQFLRDSEDVPEDVRIYGFVYDFHGVYGNEFGRAYLVNLDGTTDPEKIAAEIPDEYATATESLLY